MDDELKIDEKDAIRLLQWNLHTTRQLRNIIESLLPPDKLEQAREVADDGCLFGSKCDVCDEHVGKKHHPDCMCYIDRLVTAAFYIPTWEDWQGQMERLQEFEIGLDPERLLKDEIEAYGRRIVELQHVVMLLKKAIADRKREDLKDGKQATL